MRLPAYSSDKRLAREILEELSDGYWEWRVAERVVEVSSSWLHRLGYESERRTLHPDEWMEMIHPDDRRRAQASLDAHCEERAPGYECALRLRRRSGDDAAKLRRGRAIRREADGRPKRIVGLDIDRAAAQRLIGERGRFFELSSDLLCVADLDGRFREVNPAFLQALGWTADDLLARPFVEFVHPDDVGATIEAIEGLRRGRSQTGFENRYRCRDGSYRRLQWTAPAPPPGETVLCAAARDVTEQHRLEADLRAARRRCELAVRGARDGIWDWPDMERPEQWWSPRFYELLGFEDGEIEPSAPAWRALRHPEDEPGARAALDRALAAGEPFEAEYRLKTKSGAYRWFRSRGEAFVDPETGVRRMAGSLTDIDAYKRLAAELDEARAREAARVGELQAVNQSLLRLSRGVSDSLAEPLRRLISIVEGTDSTGASDVAERDESSRLLETVRQAVEPARLLLRMLDAQRGEPSPRTADGDKLETRP